MAGSHHPSTPKLTLNRVMFDHAPASLLLGVVTSVITAVFLFGRVSNTALAIWFGSMSFVLLLRTAVIMVARDREDRDLPVVAYTIVMGLCGAVWGSIAGLWSPELDLSDQLVILLLPLASSLALLTSLSSRPLTYRTSLLSLVICMTGFMFLHGDTSFLRLIAPLMLFILGCLYLSHRFHAHLCETLVLRVRNQQLVNDLSDQCQSLLNARDEAEAACRSKDDFLDRMSHELRTPMNGVLGMSRLLSKSQLDDEQKKLVDALNTSGENMLALVTDLLDASSLANGKLVLEDKPFNVRQTLAALQSDYSADVDHDAVSLTVHIDDEVPGYLMGDEQRVSQLVCKLFSNAVKFTERGKITINVSLDEADSDAPSSAANCRRCVLQISDTGSGIDQLELASVRKLFHQVEGTASRRFGGSGLGLTIAQGLVDLMNGTLQIDSKLGQGTVVLVQLPLRESSSAQATAPECEAADESCTESTDSAVIATHSGSDSNLQIRALVAEDNPVNQLVIESMLEELGCDITMAENGSEALLALQEHGFDIVFMDCQMPELDGYEATRQARQRGLDLPIVAVTANTLSDDRDKCLEAGMDDYVAKPFTDLALEAMLSKWVGATGLQSARSRSA